MTTSTWAPHISSRWPSLMGTFVTRLAFAVRR